MPFETKYKLLDDVMNLAILPLSPHLNTREHFNALILKHLPITAMGIVELLHSSKDHLIQPNFIHDYNCNKWLKYYQEHNFHNVDPVLSYGQNFLRKVFPWEKSLEDKDLNNPDLQHLFSKASEYGLTNGCAIAIPFTMGSSYLISFNMKEGESIEKHIEIIQLLAPFVPRFFKSLQAKELAEHLAKEGIKAMNLEIFNLLKNGKTSSEIANILDISVPNAKKRCSKIYRTFSLSGQTDFIYMCASKGLI